jgi:hypothetical protein
MRTHTRVTAVKSSSLYQQSVGKVIKSTANFIHNLTMHLSHCTEHRNMILQHCAKDAQCCIVKYYERKINNHGCVYHRLGKQR